MIASVKPEVEPEVDGSEVRTEIAPMDLIMPEVTEPNVVQTKGNTLEFIKQGVAMRKVAETKKGRAATVTTCLTKM